MRLLQMTCLGALALVFGLTTHVARADDPAPAEGPPATESACGDRSDNDGDAMIDCADADCASDAGCQPDGGAENNDARCSDWIDNDGNGHTDCDDAGCMAAGIQACRGSWDERGGSGGGDDENPLDALQAGESVEDLMGRLGDKDGEATNELCSDGDDNDGDGRVDCADLGCRFDPNVQVCRETPGMRFSVVSQLTQSYDFESKLADTRFTALQLRAFGPIPLIQDSFFLLSMRTERTPRLTFAMFQLPLGGGHYLNVNSGGGTLSTALIRSQQKQLLIEPPFYLFSAFEQGNGASAEVGGPVDAKGRLEYRVFVGGGSGRSNGNVGGRYFTYDNTNYTWTVGAQVGVDLIGFTSRWDNPMLYTPVQTALGLTVGAKYDQRAQERYPAANVRGVFRQGRFYLEAETYMKQELAFESFQLAWNVGAGFLVWPKHLYLTADVGQYLPGEMKKPPTVAETDIRRQLEETQSRAGLHWYFWRNIGVLSAIYTHRDVESLREGDPATKERELKFVGQYRF
jgi:hypothetical protein